MRTFGQILCTSLPVLFLTTAAFTCLAYNSINIRIQIIIRTYLYCSKQVTEPTSEIKVHTRCTVTEKWQTLHTTAYIYTCEHRLEPISWWHQWSVILTVPTEAPTNSGRGASWREICSKLQQIARQNWNSYQLDWNDRSRRTVQLLIFC